MVHAADASVPDLGTLQPPVALRGPAWARPCEGCSAARGVSYLQSVDCKEKADAV